ncbi:unnamed protein product [Rotaria sordida]|uniref:Uncharacterized protein n=1 Tax=Rotaria sordida TaxID=392033 RepID=A0A814SPJ6_9BILA|nr:unnamed protein product [Rotaria sordida]CAF1387447.1 unnamed protein product [Rotaria sordida]
MGCGASNIDSGLIIKLTNRSRDASIFLSGEQVECTVHFDSKLYDPDVEIKEAYIESLGQVGYTTSSIVTAYNHTGSAQTITYTDHRIPFFCEHYKYYSESASNPNRSTVQAIIVQLCQNRDMGTCGHYNTLIFDTDMFDGNDFKGEHLHNKFELTLPTHYLAPTSSYKFGLISGLTQCNPASVTYELIIDVKVSGLFNDFTLKCPIIMGVELNDERPPSYASAMSLR